MFWKILQYILVIVAIWYLPEAYVFTKNASNYIYQESVVSSVHRVEVKVVNKVPYLPLKFSTLRAGEKSMRIELISTTKQFAKNMSTDPDGAAIFLSIPEDTYTLRVGKEPGRSQEEYYYRESQGSSVFEESELLAVTPDVVVVKGDTFVVPIIK